MIIRDAQASDAEAIRSIYNHEVRNGTGVLELQTRSLEDQQRWLAERAGVHLVIVADDDVHGVVGFASLSPFKPKAAYRTTVENSVYVDPDHFRKGIGRALLIGLIDAAVDHGFHSMIARITTENTGSIALHEELGFEAVGTEREVGRKFNRWLDVLEMQRLLS